MEDDSYIVCDDCGRRTCIKCDKIWHPDKTCAGVPVPGYGLDLHNVQEEASGSSSSRTR